MCAGVTVDSPIRKSVNLTRQMRNAIASEIEARVKQHQKTIARLRSAQSAMVAAGKQVTSPLVMLAQGDSWFDYPLDGNGLSLADTDIIAQLEGMGTINPVIANISHHGEASTDEMSLPKQQHMVQLLEDPSRYLLLA